MCATRSCRTVIRPFSIFNQHQIFQSILIYHSFLKNQTKIQKKIKIFKICSTLTANLEHCFAATLELTSLLHQRLGGSSLTDKLVAKAGIEPAWIFNPTDFESVASAYFTTSPEMVYCLATFILISQYRDI